VHQTVKPAAAMPFVSTSFQLDPGDRPSSKTLHVYQPFQQRDNQLNKKVCRLAEILVARICRNVTIIANHVLLFVV